MINYELKFLTCDESVKVKNEDFKTYKYETRKKNEESVYDQGKRSFCERRGGQWRAARPRVLRELETKLRDRSIVFCEWMSDTVVTIVFSSGTIAYLTLNPDTLDIKQILFDRYCVGKLSGQSVSKVVFSPTHLLFTHTESSATLVTFSKNLLSSGVPYRIADRVPHVQSVELADGARRAERRVSWGSPSTAGAQLGTRSSPSSPSAQLGTRGSLSTPGAQLGPRVLVWTAAGADPAPWTPQTEIRANLHLYQLSGQQMNVIAYHQLENETLSAEVSRAHHNTVHIVEQIVCHKSGGVYIEWVRYSVSDREEGVVRLSACRAGETRVSLPAVARAATRSPCDLRLLVTCIDTTVHLVHCAAGVTHTARVGFMPSEVRWSRDVVVACCEEGGRLQCFDRALTPLHQHSASCLHLHQHLKESPRLRVLSSRHVTGGTLLLTVLAGGPLALLRVTHPHLPLGWLRAGRVSRAVAWLRAMDWENEGDESLHAVQGIANHARRRPLSPSSEAALQAALGSYLAPPAPLAPAADRYRPAVLALARGFFHQLLRRGRLDKALSLAVDIGAWDLFVDARWAAVRARRHNIAEEALELAQDAFRRERPESACSGSCSCCSSSTEQSAPPSSTPSPQPPAHPPPPLPRVPHPPTIMPVPIHQADNPSTVSIRPNLHQYLERDLTIWTTDVTEDRLKRSVKWRSMDDVLHDPQASRVRGLMTIEERPGRRKSSANDVTPRPYDVTPRPYDVTPRPYDATPRPYDDAAAHYGSLYQRELMPAALYRYRNGYGERGGRDREGGRLVEKNVKFSDTVTVAVVPESRPLGPSPSRELAESLPLCAPHAYLAAFEPALPPPAPAPPPAGTALDYVEV